MADDIMETVAELRRLEADATLGAWEVHDQHIKSIKDDCRDHIAPIVRTAWVHGQAKDKVPIAYRPDGLTNFSPRFWNEMKRDDAALIVAMRNNLAALLDHIENSEKSYDYAAKSWAEERERLNERIAKLEADRG